MSKLTKSAQAAKVLSTRSDRVVAVADRVLAVFRAGREDGAEPILEQIEEILRDLEPDSDLEANA